MKVLIDTNIILDVFIKREQYYKLSASVLRLCGTQLTGCIIASQTTDIFYMLRRCGKDTQAAKDILKKLTGNLKVLGINAADVQAALVSEMADYEDALLACCAKRQRAEFIITRNEKDFILSQVPALSPQMFLEQKYKGADAK